MVDKQKFEIVDAAEETDYGSYALPESINDPRVPCGNKLGVGDFENIQNVNAAEREFLVGMIDGTKLVRGDDVPLEFNYQSEKGFENSVFTRQQTLPQNSYMYRAENDDITKVYVNPDAKVKGMPPTLGELQRMSAADGITINESQLPEVTPEPEIKIIPEPKSESETIDLELITATDNPQRGALEVTKPEPEAEVVTPPIIVTEPEAEVAPMQQAKPAAIAQTSAKPAPKPAGVSPEVAKLLESMGAAKPIIATRVMDTNSTALPEITAMNSGQAHVNADSLNPINSANYQRLSTVYAPDGISKAENASLQEFANLLGKKESSKELTGEDLSKLADYQQQTMLSQVPTQVSNTPEASSNDIKSPSF